ncbi:cephalosporin hydroxylase family protein [Sinorhizobium numidicum]|uniref:Cephalosporin hydroxylase family protein n=1 Tax=Sinorhizobium numidicum TaxID=680248 RepID=A0ABY8CXC3_9HYPH|nr:cephalosporin hydroxylase family protein [Sinorhizobium numidicum]WEX76635.1 cephalosporin hydroxylase family protein [Sinorhizobium numidicum]WEX83296.1 cephalosporin hydroxylase family protein [Sinorhizobium numidicum]
MTDFRAEVAARIGEIGANSEFRKSAADFLRQSIGPKYSYNFFWMGRPIIQYPQDVVAMQEIIWATRPDLIIETGIAHGGSLILSASILALLDMSDAIEAGTTFDPRAPRRKVVGVDIDIRAHNREEIEAHPMSSRIHMIQGSSIAREVIDEVHAFAKPFSRILVCLDSNHTHDHVLAELEAYAPLTTKDSYCVVFDTIIEDLPTEAYLDRPWGKGNNPKTAVWKYLESHPEFEIDHAIDQKLMITVAPDGFLRRR